MDDGRQIDHFAAIETLLAAGEREQRLNQSLLLLAGGQQPPVVGLERLDRGIGVGERDLDQRPLPRQRSAQLVRCVGHELPLGDERSFEAAQELVERVAELLELVVGTVERKPSVQVSRGDGLGRPGHGPQPTQRAPGEQPSEADRDHGHDRQRDHRQDQQLVEIDHRLRRPRSGPN